MELRIGDFGLSSKIENDKSRNTFCGTPNYVAPEILEIGKGHSYEADIWSLGVIIFQLLTGRLPFETSTATETYARIKNGNYEVPKDRKVSKLARNLISRILVCDPVFRITVEEILEHPWMKNECGIPNSLPSWTMDKEPTQNFISKYIPQRLGGKQKDIKSCKDHDRNYLAYKQDMVKGKPVVSHMPGP